MESASDNSEKPKRRQRYKGTHPKSFKEKYKEQQPEKYAADVAKVIERGQTPAGMHRSICVQEIMDFLDVQPGQTGLDATLGYGGHSLEILKKLDGKGHLFATDVDPIELPRTQERLEKAGFGPSVFSARQLNFSAIDQLTAEAGLLDFVLADLGVSSMQIDNPDRGFSFKIDGPLDLRLNPWSGKPASALLKSITAERLEEVLLDNADEPHAEVIARAIVNQRAKGKIITTTRELHDTIASALHFIPAEHFDNDVKKACQRCFQALRIEVNHEFDVLDAFLEKLPYSLAPGGKIAILTFHSGEDRRVKKSFQRLYREGVYTQITTEPIRPSVEECARNPRAKSAKLRWAILAK